MERRSRARTPPWLGVVLARERAWAIRRPLAQTASKSYLQKWGVKATLLDRLTLYRSIPRFLWHKSFILPLRRIVAHQNALQRVGSA